ncbi:ABC transporter substrate-binding protein [Clostridia bacterium]|nr:ABC transporter substrate-binding protein [Clostridia bacterium]
MKKTIGLILAAIAAFACLTFTACGKKAEGVIRVNEVTHSIFYAPFYIADNLGYFKDEGITIELTNGGGSDVTMAALTSNSADIGLLGPETVVNVISNGKADYPVIFGQLTKRDGSFLVGKTEQPDFKWSDLTGKHILAGRKGGSPAMNLQYAIEKNGLNIADDLNFDMGVAFNLVAPTFMNDANNVYDYCTMFEPTATDCVKQGKGFIVAAVGDEAGECPFTCFAANKSYLDKNSALVEKFLKAVVKAYDYIVSNPADKVAEALLPSFDSVTKLQCVDVIDSYIRIDAWMSTPVMKEAAFNRLQDIMINAGELAADKKVAFGKAVDNSWAEKVTK